MILIKYHALLVIFEKAAKFENCLLQIIGGAFQFNTCKNHAHLEAFLKAAELTSIPVRLVDLTVSIANACVHSFVLYCSFEESLTPVNK